MQNNENNAWLCRNCNTLISNDLNTCPKCNAMRPEESDLEHSTPEGIAPEVCVTDYANDTPKPKAKYTFTESVLTFVADVTLVLGIFSTIGTLIYPAIVDTGVDEYTAMMAAICIAILILSTTLTSWALLRCIADISRRTREIHEANHQ